MNENSLDNSNRSENGWPVFVQAGDLQTGVNESIAAGINYELFRRCTHCGLCTSSCPTFVELGDENDGPRGRIQIMRMAADGRCELTRACADTWTSASIAGAAKRFVRRESSTAV